MPFFPFFWGGLVIDNKAEGLPYFPFLFLFFLLLSVEVCTGKSPEITHTPSSLRYLAGMIFLFFLVQRVYFIVEYGIRVIGRFHRRPIGLASKYLAWLAHAYYYYFGRSILQRPKPNADSATRVTTASGLGFYYIVTIF